MEVEIEWKNTKDKVKRYYPEDIVTNATPSKYDNPPIIKTIKSPKKLQQVAIKGVRIDSDPELKDGKKRATEEGIKFVSKKSSKRDVVAEREVPNVTPIDITKNDRFVKWDKKLVLKPISLPKSTTDSIDCKYKDPFRIVETNNDYSRRACQSRFNFITLFIVQFVVFKILFWK